MLENYLKTAWRNLTKSKVFSLINILGLTLGIAVCMLIFIFILNEFSADKFHKNGDRIFRVVRGYQKDKEHGSVAYVTGRYAPALKNDFSSDIAQVVRVDPSNYLVTIGNNSFNEKHVYHVDDNFLSVFTFPLIIGDPATALQNPNSVVLTETTAKKYFGSAEKAMGQVVTLDQHFLCKVTGVARDVPANSHLSFDILAPLSMIQDAQIMQSWISNGLYTYVMLNKNVSKQLVEQRLPKFVEKYLGGELRKYGFHWDLTLTPLKDVYFDTQTGDGEKHGDKTVVYIFISIAVLILLIACINFTNLSTIRAVDRSKEIGLRKVLGALRNNLVWQFIGESMLLTTLASVLAIVVVLIAMPWYNEILGYSLSVSWNAFPVYAFILGVIIIVGMLAGSYPAFFLSTFSPIQSLKGKLNLGTTGATFRQTLVIVQFTISVLLIIGTITITKQMRFVEGKQLGYNKEQLVAIPIDNEDIYKNLNAFKINLQAQNNIEQVSAMSGEPGGFFDGQTFDVEGHAEKWNGRTEFADFQFVSTLGLKIIAGRDFSPSFPTDSTDAVLINNTAATKLGWTPQQAIGKWLLNTVRDSTKRRIVGVVADFNYESLKKNIEPLVISPARDRRVVLVKLKPGNVQSGMSAIQNVYKAVAPAYPLEYEFLDGQFNDLYKKDIRQQKVLTVFAMMAIFVASLGLFGLASFAATKRFKEIGVRKVLGSSVRSVVLLLSTDLLKPVIIASFIALPIGYFAMTKWLENFAYQTKLNWWVFVLAAFIAFAIALATVCIKAVKAALANPVQSLRGE
jgi:putative ABC transport system permease protein